MAADLKTIGWREWVRLPALSDLPVKAKVDTGARTSSLHAFDISELERDGGRWVRFSFNPIQDDEETVATAEAPFLDQRHVTASNGQSELRYVVEAEAVIDGDLVPIELTLSRRDVMGFRMLLGRRAIRGRFVVDPQRSFRTAESKEVRRRAKKERGSR